MKRIPSLDGFRAISIIMVIFCHARLSTGFPGNLIDIARNASVGVTFFFVISGFLITHLLLVEELENGQINLRAFYLRRIFRIVPVYVLYVAFLLIWRSAGIENLRISNSNLLHVATFTANFDNKVNWYAGHFWSLSVEEQFYLFWPGLLILSRKHLKSILVILIMYSCIARVIGYKFPAYQLLTLSPFFSFSDAIFIGALGGILYFENPDIVKKKLLGSYFFQTIALCLAVAFVYFSGYGKLAIISLPFGTTIISASVLFLLLAYINPTNTIVFKFLNNKFIVHIGVLSYSIYIWQEFFVVGEFSWRTFPINILIIYAVSLASYYLWEKPFLKLKKYFQTYKLRIIAP